MKEKISILICVLLLGIVVFFPSMVVAHGGGGGGGGGGSEDGDSFGVSSSATEEYLMGGGVSWTPNPNGPGIRGSSIYDGRPDNIEKGPYQSGWAIEYSEALMFDEDGNLTGRYTPAEVMEQLEWATRVGIKVSDAALLALDQMAEEMQQLLALLDDIEKQEAEDNKQGGEVEKRGDEVNAQDTSSGGNTWTEEQQDKAVSILNLVNAYNKADPSDKKFMLQVGVLMLDMN